MATLQLQGLSKSFGDTQILRSIDLALNEGEMLVIRHVYIERRMIPLNIYLQDASPAQIARAASRWR